MQTIYDDQKEKTTPTQPQQGQHDNLGVHPERREAEIDDLNNLYDAESAPEANYPTSNAENQESDNISSNFSDHSRDKGNWDNKTNDKQKSKWYQTNKKKAAAGGGFAGIMLGGGIGFSVFLSGPLQLMQFSELVQQFHFNDSKRFGNSRVAKLYKYATKKPIRNQDYNLSRSGNKIAVHYEKKLRKKGISIEYNDGPGRVSKISIDPNTVEGRQLINRIEADAGTSIPKNKKTGTVDLDLATSSTEMTSARVRRQNISAAVNAMEMNGISSALAKRMLKVRGGVNLNPLKNLSRYIDEKANLKYHEWKDKVNKERANRIQEGSKPPNDIKTSSGEEDPDNPPSEENKAKDADTNKNIKEVQDIAKDSSRTFSDRVSAIGSKLRAGVGVASLVGILCGLDAISDSVAATQEENIIEPLIRTGMDIIATGAQIKSGQDVNMSVLGAISDTLYDKDKKTSWMSAESIQTELGRPGVGVKMDDATKPGKSKPAFFEVLDTITGAPGISQACSAMGSTIGSFTMSVVGIAVSATGVGGIVFSVAGEVVSEVASRAFMDDLVRVLAGSAPEIAKAVGGTLGNYVNFGAFLANNNSMQAMGGRSLSEGEKRALATETKNEIIQQNKQKSIFARLLDISDANSLISKTIIQNNSLNNPKQSLVSIINSPLNIIGSLGSNLMNLNPKAGAQSTMYDYGVDKIGFSIDERESPLVENPYDNAAVVEPKLADLNKKYGEKCFGTTIDPETGKISYSKGPSYKDLESNKGQCGESNTDEDYLRYRMYLADMIAMSGMSCYENIEGSDCAEIGIESGGNSSSNNQIATPLSGGSTGVDTSSQQCTIGTDAGIGATPDPNKKIKLCTVEGITVNVSIEGNLKKILDGARAAGINISGSSYRSYDSQVELRKSHCGTSHYAIYEMPSSSCSPPTARPGSSNHEWGLALDLTVGGSTIGRGSAAFNWLQNNQAIHGLKNLPSEAWHWSVNGN